ncbi:SDR family oxidoreductase, partial [Streptomyces pristinaespiralis]
MRVAVAGGTGLAGRHVVGELRAAGHEPVVLARSKGVDVTTGQGLAEALAGVEAVIDVTNAATLSRRKAVAFFEAASRHLLAAGERAGVRHHVVLSIVGIERVGHGYYQGKIRQEQVVAGGPVPWTVLRTTQFHEFADQLLDGMPGPLAVIPRMRVQPVGVREVARALTGLAEGPAQGMAPELAGPREGWLLDMVRRLLPTLPNAASCCRSRYP